jgi:septal ring factor EnvC (AmiA/AmiB activator)
MTTQTSHFRKTMPAFTAALGMTALIALLILAFGLNALLNRNTVPIKASAAAPQDAAALNSQNAALQQLQSQITQYQARETQYQTQLQQAADQINQLTQQNQQYQNLVNYLQNIGLIQVTQDGRVFINRNSSSNGGGGG